MDNPTKIVFPEMCAALCPDHCFAWIPEQGGYDWRTRWTVFCMEVLDLLLRDDRFALLTGKQTERITPTLHEIAPLCCWLSAEQQVELVRRMNEKCRDLTTPKGTV